MAQDFEGLFKDLFGDSFSRLTQFQSDQMQRLTSKIQELAREAIQDDLTKLHTELTELRTRVATLEAERVEQAADGLQSSF